MLRRIVRWINRRMRCRYGLHFSETILEHPSFWWRKCRNCGKVSASMFTRPRW